MKIHIRESAVDAMRKVDGLPKFLVDAVRRHKTSLGPCPAFPDSGEGDYDYKLRRHSFDDIMADVKASGVKDLNVEHVRNRLAKLVMRCKEIEKPSKPKLEKVCENTVKQRLACLTSVVHRRCSLGDRIKVTSKVNSTPDDAGNAE